MKIRASAVRPEHPYRWLWEPLEKDPGFALSAMFGGKSLYLDGRLSLFFIARQPPWQGILICTDRERQQTLKGEFPELHTHPVLKKWLYLAERQEGFERLAARLVELAGARDPRIGVAPSKQPRRRSA